MSPRAAAADFRADFAIVAVPPPMAAHIRHEPVPDARATIGGTLWGSSTRRSLSGHSGARPAAPRLIMMDGPDAASSTVRHRGQAPVCSGRWSALVLDQLARPTAGRILSALAGNARPRPRPGRLARKSWHLDPMPAVACSRCPASRANCCPMSATSVRRVHWAGSESAEDRLPGRRHQRRGALRGGARLALAGQASSVAPAAL